MLPEYADRTAAPPGASKTCEPVDGSALLVRWGLCVLCAALAVPAIADRCKVRYAEAVDIGRCGTAQLPDFRVSFTGITQPQADLPLSCWNYVATARRSSASVTLSNCHTGELAGEQEFELDGKPYLFVHGVTRGCRPLADGGGTPITQGDAFVPGRRDGDPIRAFRADQSREAARCNRASTGAEP